MSDIITEETSSEMKIPIHALNFRRVRFHRKVILLFEFTMKVSKKSNTVAKMDSISIQHTDNYGTAQGQSPLTGKS